VTSTGCRGSRWYRWRLWLPLPGPVWLSDLRRLDVRPVVFAHGLLVWDEAQAIGDVAGETLARFRHQARF
jgi:hypothetical protein